MIKIEKKEIKACCGKKQTIWKLNAPIDQYLLPTLQQAGFSYLRSYLDAGMLYIEDSNLIARGVFGQNELSIKCKNSLCSQSSFILENILKHNLSK